MKPDGDEEVLNGTDEDTGTEGLCDTTLRLLAPKVGINVGTAVPGLLVTGESLFGVNETVGVNVDTTVPGFLVTWEPLLGVHEGVEVVNETVGINVDTTVPGFIVTWEPLLGVHEGVEVGPL